MNTELPATTFMIGAALVLVRGEIGWRRAALAGFLMALATMTRTNLAVVAAAFGVLLLIKGQMPGSTVRRYAFISYGIAGSLVPLCLVLVYGVTGELRVFKLAMIDMPAAYTQQISIFQTISYHYGDLHYFARTWPLIFLPAGILGSIGLGRCTDIILRRPEHRWTCSVVLMMTSATELSLLIGGSA